MEKEFLSKTNNLNERLDKIEKLDESLVKENQFKELKDWNDE